MTAPVMELNLPGLSSKNKAASMSDLHGMADRSSRTAWLLRYCGPAWAVLSRWPWYLSLQAVLACCSCMLPCAAVSVSCRQYSVLTEFMAQGLVPGCSCFVSCDVQMAVSGIEQLNGWQCLFCTPGEHICCSPLST